MDAQTREECLVLIPVPEDGLFVFFLSFFFFIGGSFR
jgi:hypothetical protein